MPSHVPKFHQSYPESPAVLLQDLAQNSSNLIKKQISNSADPGADPELKQYIGQYEGRGQKYRTFSGPLVNPCL